MSEVERILLIAEDYGIRLEVLAEASNIKNQTGHVDLCDLYLAALEKVAKSKKLEIKY